MKQLFAIATMLALAIGSVEAQTIISSTNPPANFFPTNTPVQPFINVLANYVTSYNTSLYWTNEFSIDTGIATTTGQNIADKLRLVDDFGNFEVGASGEFTGVGSAFSELEALGGYALVNKYDFKLAIELGAGYDFNKTNQHGKKVGAIVVDPGIEAYKKITQVTYTTVGYAFPLESVGKFNSIGVFYAGVGFTF